MESKKTIALVITIILVVSAILFIESQKTRYGDVDQEIKELAIDPTLSQQSDKEMPDMPDDGTKAVEFTQEDIERISQKEKRYTPAIELVNPDGYINTESINLADLIGEKVILLDFWTYSCINCQRTLPYLTSWYEKYKDQGFVIVGIHTPEFNFEKDYDNVLKATQKFGVEYPVVQDNNYYTWRAYSNRYWPRKYMIDIDGFVVYDHIGEGAYEETELKIQELLKERKEVLGIELDIEEGVSDISAVDVDFGKIRTPEVYFGTSFARGGTFGNIEGLSHGKTISYKIPSVTRQNKAYVEGEWLNKEESMVLTNNMGKILLRYNAKAVNIVAGADKEIEVSIFLDGTYVKDTIIKGFDLYNLVDSEAYGDHTLEIEINDKGLEIYTFTFG